jgi:hypothetical protein
MMGILKLNLFAIFLQTKTCPELAPIEIYRRGRIPMSMSTSAKSYRRKARTRRISLARTRLWRAMDIALYRDRC